MRWSTGTRGAPPPGGNATRPSGTTSRGKTVLLVDDGLATGATMRAAVEAARSGGAARVVAAAPVGSVEAEAAVAAVCDAVLCLHLPGKFRAVGSFYRRFEQLTDEDAISQLNQ